MLDPRAHQLLRETHDAITARRINSATDRLRANLQVDFSLHSLTVAAVHRERAFFHAARNDSVTARQRQRQINAFNRNRAAGGTGSAGSGGNRRPVMPRRSGPFGIRTAYADDVGPLIMHETYDGIAPTHPAETLRLGDHTHQQHEKSVEKSKRNAVTLEELQEARGTALAEPHQTLLEAYRERQEVRQGLRTADDAPEEEDPPVFVSDIVVEGRPAPNVVPQKKAVEGPIDIEERVARRQLRLQHQQNEKDKHRKYRGRKGKEADQLTEAGAETQCHANTATAGHLNAHAALRGYSGGGGGGGLFRKLTRLVAQSFAGKGTQDDMEQDEPPPEEDGVTMGVDTRALVRRRRDDRKEGVALRKGILPEGAEVVEEPRALFANCQRKIDNPRQQKQQQPRDKNKKQNGERVDHTPEKNPHRQGRDRKRPQNYDDINEKRRSTTRPTHHVSNHHQNTTQAERNEHPHRRSQRNKAEGEGTGNVKPSASRVCFHADPQTSEFAYVTGAFSQSENCFGRRFEC